MTIAAEHVAEPPVAAPEATRRPRRSARSQRRIASGVLWIAVFTVLLGGIVALSVAVLRLNLRLDRLGQERAELHARNATLASQLSSAAASARIQSLAPQHLGLVPAQAADTYYLDLTPH